MLDAGACACACVGAEAIGDMNMMRVRLSQPGCIDGSDGMQRFMKAISLSLYNVMDNRAIELREM